MGKKLHRNGFIEGTFIAYFAIIISKLLGALYSIPFYSMIGEEGGVIYSCAYNIYALFLDVSTCGIPIAVSIVISEYCARGMYRSKERAYRLASYVVSVISVLSFLLLQIFAEQLGKYFLGDMTQGVTVGQIAAGIRSISICLLIAPFLSLKRGYLQGHKFLAPASASQVIEQVVRIAVVLGGAYLAIYWLDWGSTAGVCIALTGAAVGAVAAYVYLSHKHWANRRLFPRGRRGEPLAADGEIVRKIATYCLTLVIVSVANSVYSIVDMKMLLTGLHKLGYGDQETQVIASISSTWIPKICMMITALSMGLSSSIAPHMAESRARGDMGGVGRKLNQAVSTLLLVSLPLGGGMILLAEPIFRIFYGQSLYGSNILQLSVIVNVIGCMATTIGMSMQSIRRGKTVCFATLIGIILNAALDLPLIYLFDQIGIPAYLGAAAASIVGQTVNVAILIVALKRSYGFSFRRTRRNLLRMALPLSSMVLAVLGMEHLWPLTDARSLGLVAQLLVYALVGAAVYLPLAWITGAIPGILGKDFLRRLQRK